MSRYTILQVSAEAYADIRDRIVAIDEKIGQGPVYQKEFIRPAFRAHPERLALDQVHLEALPPAPAAVTNGDLGDHFKVEALRTALAAVLGAIEGLGFDPSLALSARQFEHLRPALQSGRGALKSTQAEESGDQPSADPRDEPLRWFLRMLAACGGQADATDTKHNPIQVFCADFEPLDTFNLAHDLGLTRVSHNTDWDTGEVFLTDAGRAWLASHAAAPAEARTDKPEREA